MIIHGISILFELSGKQWYEELCTFFTTDSWTNISVWQGQTKSVFPQGFDINYEAIYTEKAMKGPS